jgi:hypothetical protein
MLTKMFNEVAEDPLGWIVAGVISCMAAHALMIPLGMETWLEHLLE